MICFEVGEDDAKAVAPFMKPQFDVSDLIKLGQYRAAVSMRYGRQRQPAFEVNTMPPPSKAGEQRTKKQPVNNRDNELRDLSVQNYTPMTYKEVQEWLDRRYNFSSLEYDGDEEISSLERGKNEFIEPKNET